METRSNYAIVGAVAVAIMIGMFAAVLWLAKLSGSDNQQFDIFFKQSITGLAIGSAVAFNGVPVGKIEQIRLLPETPQFVRVRISVASDVPVLKGTTASVEGVGFTGVSQVALSGAMQGASRITEPGPFGVPVIPPRLGGFGALLDSAPELLANISRLSDRLGELLNENNSKSIGHILANTERLTGSFADRSQEIAATIVEARATLLATTNTLKRVDGLVNATAATINSDGRPLLADLRRAAKAAEASLRRIDAITAAAEPGITVLTNQTLPETGQLVRDLRDVTSSLGAIAAKFDEDPAGALIGGRTLPDYRPAKPEKAK